MKKKIIAIILVLLLVVIFISGCISKSNKKESFNWGYDKDLFAANVTIEIKNEDELTINEKIFFNGSKSNSSQQIDNYTWDFRDGTFGYGNITTHEYSNYGPYEITLIISNSSLGKVSAKKIIYIN